MAVEFLGTSLYIWIAAASFAFLFVLVALGGFGLDLGGDVDAGVDLDYGDAGPGLSPLSLPLVAAFGTSFGATGALLERRGTDPLVTPLVAAMMGILIAIGLYFAVQRFLVRAQASTDVRLDNLVGRDAQVLIPIRKGAQGQILVITEERGRSLFPAVAEEDIGRDSIVEIIGRAGGVANVRRKSG